MSDLYPGSFQIPPMLIGRMFGRNTLIQEQSQCNYIGQIKKDGIWYQLEKTDDGQVYLFSRAKDMKTGEFVEKIENVPHIKEWAEQLPNGTILIGEIYYPQANVRDAIKIMRAKSDRAASFQRNSMEPIHYYIHDIIRYDGKFLVNNGYERRYADLYEHIALKCDNPEYIEVASSVTSRLSNLLRYAIKTIQSGEEGIVLKSKQGIYLPGERPKYNCKITEPCGNICLIITGFIKPYKYHLGSQKKWKYYISGEPVTKEYYYGWISGFQVSGYINGKLTYVGDITSGVSDAMKRVASYSTDEYLGQVCETEVLSWSMDLKIKNPRFIRLRNDKSPEECIVLK